MELKRTRIASTFLLLLLLLLCLFLYTSVAFTVRHGDAEEEREGAAHVYPKPSLWEIFRNRLSLYTSSPLKVSSFKDKVKSITGQLPAYFFSPNLDFKMTSGSDDNSRAGQSSGPRGDGAGEKMRDAASKSFEKSKEAVEDSAKLAAKAAGETVKMTKEKVKQSFSHKEGHQPEL